LLRREMVYVGVNAGSMAVTPDFGGEGYGGANLPAGDDRALGLVDFSLVPHLDRVDFPDNSLANVEKWAAKISLPTYAIDDQTAIRVTDGTVDVVSEGHWKMFTR
jgi:dipeptidase E